MNKILSYVRRCVEDYDMIQAGDRVRSEEHTSELQSQR